MTDSIDDLDPYEPPKSEVGEHPSKPLHPVKGVVWAAFWGGLVGASIVMAINFWRTGRRSAAQVVVIVGVLGTLAVFVAMYFIPDETLDRIPSVVFWAPQMMLAYFVALGFQNQAIESHVRNGGVVASAWKGVGIGALCLPFLVGAIFGVGYLMEPSFGTVANFGNDEIYYSGDATKEDVQKLAEILEAEEWFGSDGISVRLESSSGLFTISFVVVNNAWRDSQIVEGFRYLGQSILESGFPPPLTIQMCDEYFSVKKTLSVKGYDPED